MPPALLALFLALSRLASPRLQHLLAALTPPFDFAPSFRRHLPPLGPRFISSCILDSFGAAIGPSGILESSGRLNPRERRTTSNLNWRRARAQMAEADDISSQRPQ